MTSIEALQALKVFIKKFIDFEKEYTPMDFEKWFFKTKFETIQKDLEILEILKQYIIYKDYGNDMESYVLNKTIHKANYSYGEGWEKELEEFNKIKEWLEDAKS